MRPMHRQRGFNLIETLIALVILSLGLLGIAGLQLMGVRANQGSYFRSQATSIMSDMAERMHNNIPGVNGGFYAGFDSAAGCGGAPTICAQEAGTAPVQCNAQQMAVYDTFVIACGMRSAGAARVDRITDLLPGGQITVNCLNNATPPAVVNAAACQRGFRHQIAVSWDERVQSSGANAAAQGMERQTVTLVMQP